jgi:hypothetical protein
LRREKDRREALRFPALPNRRCFHAHRATLRSREDREQVRRKPIDTLVEMLSRVGKPVKLAVG